MSVDEHIRPRLSESEYECPRLYGSGDLAAYNNNRGRHLQGLVDTQSCRESHKCTCLCAVGISVYTFWCVS